MIANQITKVTNSGSPCGCGGATTSLAMTCSCGGAGCNLCQGQSFVRPRFFAGQLLTEDDLQMLAEYTTTKNRLHNRFLFGQGVVCGLEVACHPCGDGRVIVRPGYAIDCCGNDITLACEQLLDINAMIRDLRRRLLGFDCGDPCANNQTSSQATENPATTQPGTHTPPPDNTRHYCLFIRYCEELTDPVSPFSTGESCATQVCEPTRIREGVRFELRCQEAAHPPKDLFSRVCQCLDDLGSIEKSAGDVRYFQQFANQTDAALTAIQTKPVPDFTIQQVNSLTNAIPEVDNLLKNPPTKDTLTPAMLETWREATLNLLSPLANFYVQNDETQSRLIHQFGSNNLAAKIEDAKSRFANLKQIFTPQLINLAPLSTLAKADAIALFNEVGSVVVASNVSQAERVNNIEARLLVERVVFNRNVIAAIRISLDALRQWLLNRMDKSFPMSDCGLRKDVEAVRLPEPSTQPRISLSDVTATLFPTRKLAEAFRRHLNDCFCAALNPSCQPCDDTAVLLACLEIKDCEVVRICNLERTFVLSPAALRYWLPQLRQLGSWLEAICCPAKETPIRRDVPGPASVIDFTPVSRFPFAGVSEFEGRFGGSLEFELLRLFQSSFIQACGKDVKEVQQLDRVITMLFPSMSVRQITRQFDFLQGIRRDVPERGIVDVEGPQAAAPVAITAAPALSLGDLGPAVHEEIRAMIEKEVRARLAKTLKPEADAATTAPKETLSDTSAESEGGDDKSRKPRKK